MSNTNTEIITFATRIFFSTPDAPSALLLSKTRFTALCFEPAKLPDAKEKAQPSHHYFSALMIAQRIGKPEGTSHATKPIGNESGLRAPRRRSLIDGEVTERLLTERTPAVAVGPREGYLSGREESDNARLCAKR